MTDINQKVVVEHDSLMWTIQSCLSPQELNTLRLAPKFFSNEDIKIRTLRFLYKSRLCLIDTTLLDDLGDFDHDPISAFDAAINKIQTKQQKEIVFLKEKHPKYPFSIFKIEGSFLERIEKTDTLLNQINRDIIRQEVKKQPKTALDLIDIGITRFVIPEDCQDYFANLESLYCAKNQLTDLKNLAKCPALRVLSCYDNQLTSLNLTKNVFLQQVNCWNNELSNLNLTGCREVDVLSCGNNPLISLNLTGCVNLYQITSISDKTLTDLNITGASLTVQKLLGCLEEKILFQKLNDASFFERGDLVQRLGSSRYNVLNCIKYACVYDATYLSYSCMTSFLPSFSTIYSRIEEGVNNLKIEENHKTTDSRKRKLN